MARQLKHQNARWHRASQKPRDPGWYPVNYPTLHPGILFGQPGSFEKYWDGRIWTVAGPGTPQSGMGDEPQHQWQG
jgi:hypothetical protein